MAETEGSTVWIHCNDCRSRTKHILVKRIRSSGEDNDQGFRWSTTWDVLQCRGCEEVVLRRVFWFSENENEQENFFPPRVSRWTPSWAAFLPSDIKRLLEEVYRALQADSSSIGMMGARSIIEATMISKVGDLGTFADNLKGMEEAGVLSRTNRQFLEVALDAGNATIHRGHRPDADQLNTVMDIVENLLQSVFVLEKPTKRLKGAIPRRKRKKRP